MLTFAVRPLREPVIRATVLALICMVTAALLLTSPVVARDPEAPPGNNGTIKVHDGDGEPTPIRRNEPRVCSFHLHLFGADAGQSGEWLIRSWPPTGDRTVVLDGTYTADDNGEARDPATGVHELDPGHYKLFWGGDLTPGGQTPIKHKVFWVDCPAGGDTLPTSEEGNLAGQGGPGAGLVPDTTTEASGGTQVVGLLVLISAIGAIGVAWILHRARGLPSTRRRED